MPVHSYPLERYLTEETPVNKKWCVCVWQNGESILQIVGPYGYGKQKWYITNLLIYDSFLTSK